MDFKFNTGDTIEIEVENNGSINKYKTLVDSSTGCDYIVAHVPIHAGKVLLLQPGKTLRLFFSKYNAGIDSYEIFRFKAQLEAREIRDGISMINIRRVGEITKVQRRDYFRLSYVKNMLVERLSDGQTLEVLTKDVSVGGMRFVSKVKLEKGENVNCMLAFEDAPIIAVTGEVINCELLPDSTLNYDVRVKLDDVSKDQRSEIIGHINRIQAEYLKRIAHEQYEEHMEAIMAPINLDRLDQYNDDVGFENKMGYFKALLALLSIVMVALFFLSRPNSAYPVSKFFNIVYQKGWSVLLLRGVIVMAVTLVLATLTGIWFNYQHYGERQKISKMFVGVIGLSLLMTAISLYVISFFV